MKKISILILTHNAPDYVYETLKTLNLVTDLADRNISEIIVYDNASDKKTKQVIQESLNKGWIDKVYFSKSNILFAGGNNEATKLAAPSTEYYLLLNSDVKIKNRFWLRILLNAKKRGHHGIVSLGACYNPPRADGYCFLIDKYLYDHYKLDENFQWWWSITKLQSNILKEGKSILAFKNHENLLHHYGGASGKDYKDAKGMNTSIKDVCDWFDKCEGKIQIKKASICKGLISLVNHYKY